MNPSPIDGAAADLSMAFAQAVAKPGSRALLLDQDNRLAGFVPIERALTGGRAFAVEVDSEILAIDCDDEGLTPALDSVVQRAEQLGYRPVRVASGRPGHQHLFVRVDDPEHMATLTKFALDHKLDVRRGQARIRPPLSPHRSGLKVSLLIPTDASDALHRLRPQRPKPALAQRLPGKTYALLANGDQAGRFSRPGESSTDASRMLQSIVFVAVAHGFPKNQLFAMLMNHRNKGGAHLHKMPERAARRAFERSWNRASERQIQTREKIRGLLRRALGELVGRTGSYDQAVYVALVNKALDQGSPVVAASIRQIAEGAGVANPTTVSRILRRLIEKGWLRRVDEPERGNIRSSSYELTSPLENVAVSLQREARPQGMVLNVDRGSSEFFLQHVGDDVFRRSYDGDLGLGKTRWRIVCTLKELGPTSLADLANVLGVARQTVWRNLKELEARNIIERRMDGAVTLVGTPDLSIRLNRVAIETGIVGARSRQRSRFADEREQYQATLLYGTRRPGAGPR